MMNYEGVPYLCKESLSGASRAAQGIPLEAGAGRMKRGERNVS
jgi:hypothetical protein